VSLPGINIQVPYAQLLLSGKKSIETRTYPIPKKYLGRDLFIIETYGKLKKPAMVVGVIRFESCFEYGSKKAFEADVAKHLVATESPFHWNNQRPKWAWIVGSVRTVEPFRAPANKGICWTESISVSPTLSF